MTRYHHDIPRKKGENEKALVTKEMGLGFLEKNIFIGDSAATSHMTSRKLSVYDLVPINGSVMIGNGKSISCTHKGNWISSASTRMDPWPEKLGKLKLCQDRSMTYSALQKP